MNKKYVLTALLFVFALLFSAGNASAQEEKSGMKKMKKEMSMEEMHKSPHHRLMMAYRQNLVTFASALRDAARPGETLDREFARATVEEIRRSAGKMREIHQDHMAMMTPEMRDGMAEMMQKMQSQQAKVEEHIAALERLVAVQTLDGKEIEKHAGELVSEFGKMKMKDKDKMKEKMKDKKMKKDNN